MFLNRKKVMRVALVHSVPHASPLDRPTTANNTGSEQRFDLDGLFKIFAVLVATANGVLLICGYMRSLAKMELYGIHQAEVDVSLQNLLLEGYFALMPGSSGWGAIILGSVLGLTAVIATLLVMPNSSGARQYAAAMLLAGVALGAIYLPVLVYKDSRDAALRTVVQALHLDPTTQTLAYDHEIASSQGPLKGQLITADSNFSFVRVGNVVYKIQNGSNQIVRTSRLSERNSELPPAGEGH